MKPVHYLQAGLAGIIQCGMTLAIVLPPNQAHYVLIGIVGLISLLTPLGILSPSAAQAETQAISQLQNTVTSTVTTAPKS